MCAEFGEPAAQVAEAVPVRLFTAKDEAATPFAPARPTPSAMIIVTVTGPPPLAGFGAAVMLLMLKAAGLTDVTEKFDENGHELQLSPAGAVPVSDTDIVPLARGVPLGVTV